MFKYNRVTIPFNSLSRPAQIALVAAWAASAAYMAGLAYGMWVEVQEMKEARRYYKNKHTDED